jgi:hypothetical protein
MTTQIAFDDIEKFAKKGGERFAIANRIKNYPKVPK